MKLSSRRGRYAGGTLDVLRYADAMRYPRKQGARHLAELLTLHMWAQWRSSVDRATASWGGLTERPLTWSSPAAIEQGIRETLR